VVNGPNGPYEDVAHEMVLIEYVYWKDFGHTLARKWQDIEGGWFKVYFTKEECIEQFGEEAASKLNYSYGGSNTKDKDNYEEEVRGAKKACIYEVWDKKRKSIIHLTKEKKESLRIKPDFLGLRSFYPFPEPLFADLVNESLEPIPLYRAYSEMAEELDLICRRISYLTEDIKWAALMDAEYQPEVQRLFQAHESTFIPVKNFRALLAQSGSDGKGILLWTPIKEAAEVLGQLYNAKQAIEANIYQITGISDIIRGHTSPSETATAQQIKGQFATLRISEHQARMQVFCKRLIEKIAEIVSEKFKPDTIWRLANADSWAEEDKALFEPALAMLRNDVTRNFKIDIETDSTINIDEGQEKQNVNEYLQAVAQLMGQAQQIIQFAPEMKLVALETLKFGLRRYRAGRSLEATLDKAISDHLAAEEEAKNQPPPEPPPDPEMLKAQSQMEIGQMKMQLDQAKAENKMQIQQMQAETKAQVMQYQSQMQAQKTQSEIQIEQMRLQYETMLAQEKLKADTAVKAQELETKRMEVLMSPRETEGEEKESTPPIVNVTANIIDPGRKVGTFKTLPNGDRQLFVEPVR
jgi:hypothetical protein